MRDFSHQLLENIKHEGMSNQCSAIYWLLIDAPYGKKYQQHEIAEEVSMLGHHEVHECHRPQIQTTLRKVRQLIRNLRIIHRVPILSDREGYWIAENSSECWQFVKDWERRYKASAAAYYQTFKFAAETLGIDTGIEQLSMEELIREKDGEL